MLTTLLNEMDGVQESFGVTVVAATNRPEAIVGYQSPSFSYANSSVCVQDSALTRPGRLDRLVYVGPPDFQGREEILRIRLSKMSVDPAVDVSEIARLVCSHAATPGPPLTLAQTDGCSGAEVVSICQEAALLTMKENIDAPFVSHS